jgi:hypothetical protein
VPCGVWKWWQNKVVMILLPTTIDKSVTNQTMHKKQGES